MNTQRSYVARHFGTTLKTLRTEAGVTQEELAESVDCDRTYPSLLERGLRTPTLTMLFRLADSLKVDAAMMVTMTRDRMQAKIPGVISITVHAMLTGRRPYDACALDLANQGVPVFCDVIELNWAESSKQTS